MKKPVLVVLILFSLFLNSSGWVYQQRPGPNCSICLWLDL